MSEKSSRGNKREIPKEEISDFIDQGYYFRIKKSQRARRSNARVKQSYLKIIKKEK